MPMPTIKRYAPGNNNHVVEITGLQLFFSYGCCIAIQYEDCQVKVRDYEPGKGTKSHRRAIDGGTKWARFRRVQGPVFDEMVQRIISNPWRPFQRASRWQPVVPPTCLGEAWAEVQNLKARIGAQDSPPVEKPKKVRRKKVKSQHPKCEWDDQCFRIYREDE